MKTLFSGNVDLLAVAVIVAAAGIGSSINFEHRVTARVADRIVTRARMKQFDHKIMETRREINAVLKTIACER
jgi:hypothetical protein